MFLERENKRDTRLHLFVWITFFRWSLTAAECSQKTSGRKEGSVGERPSGDELFEAQRVVKLRLVQAKTGETRQLWKSGGGQPQVSLPL